MNDLNIEKRQQLYSREKETWPKGQDIVTHRFHLISFTSSTKGYVSSTKGYIPTEISMAEFSLKEGITKVLHGFINWNKDNDATTGELWHEMHKFIETGNEGGIYSPVYSFAGRNRESFEFLKFLQGKANSDTNHFNDGIFWVEYLIKDLCKQVDVEVPYNDIRQVTSVALRPDISSLCDYHAAQNDVHCALGMVKTLAHVITEYLQKFYSFVTTPLHRPEKHAARSMYSHPSPKEPIIERESKYDLYTITRIHSSDAECPF